MLLMPAELYIRRESIRKRRQISAMAATQRIWRKFSGLYRSGSAFLVGNPLRPTQVATSRVVPLTGLLSLLDFDVVTEVEPFQSPARTMHVNIGRVAVVSSYDVVGDVAELGAEGTVGGTAQFGCPHESCLRHLVTTPVSRSVPELN